MKELLFDFGSAIRIWCTSRILLNLSLQISSEGFQGHIYWSGAFTKSLSWFSGVSCLHKHHDSGRISVGWRDRVWRSVCCLWKILGPSANFWWIISVSNSYCVQVSNFLSFIPLRFLPSRTNFDTNQESAFLNFGLYHDDRNTTIAKAWIRLWANICKD